MLLRIDPLWARVAGRLGGNRSPRDVAVETVELAPAIVRPSPAAIALPGEFDRVIQFQHETSPEHELSRVSAGDRRHGATTAYRLKDVLLADGRIYYRGGYTNFRQTDYRRVLTGPMEHIMQAALTTSSVAERYFGHWLCDALLMEQLAAQRGLPALTFERRAWSHEPGYRAALGLDATKVRQATVGDLWLFDDVGLNDGMVERLQALRGRIAARRPAEGPSHVFMRRGAMGTARVLTNQQAIEDALAQRGFTIIDPEQMAVDALIATLSHARTVVLVEGSAQSHVIHTMRKGGVALTIQPPRRFNAVLKPYADALGFHWAYAVADDAENGFTMPVDRLLRTMDLAETAAGA
ncbi:glycosyltransferase family 61 protein [uncultured Sphingomonas sp.]|uniref:glycosyltransferase 61 family protein n=1 Tax=uncultured Sphingomonas sp. TaxID=158754 RepID=UPI0025D50229|nr:glycosyltransferase family 61 protein [uncultured Sphingomonas sp.]